MIADISPELAIAAGPLLPYLDAPNIQEVRVTSAGRCFIVEAGKGKRRVEDIEVMVLDAFLSLIAHKVGQHWQAKSPRLHAADPRLGIRIQAAMPPVTTAPMLVCRKHPEKVFTLEEFEGDGILQTIGMTEVQQGRLEYQGSVRATLEAALQMGKTIAFSGAVGSSKTSLINAFLHSLRSSPRRIGILEDDRELKCDAEEVETMRTWEPLGITMQDLARDVLRLAFDLLVVGEVRGRECLEMCKAFQCGTQGLVTIHADSARGTLMRMEELNQEVSVDPQRALIGTAIDVVCHLTKYGGSWRVTELLAVDGYDRQQDDYLLRRLA